METTKLVIVEDNQEQAAEYAAEINEDQIVQDVIFISSLYEFEIKKLNILRKESQNFFVVDISLNGPQNTDGYTIIEEARTSDPGCYIIAYSAHHGHKSKAKEKGADIFLKKSGKDYDSHMDSIREFIEYKIREKEKWDSVFEISCVVLDINEINKKVLLRLFDPGNKEQYSDKVFPLSDFEHFSELFVNKPVLIQVLKRGNKRVREIKELSYSPQEITENPELEKMDDIFSI